VFDISFLYRGMGLFIGVELVKDLTTKGPATGEARRVVYK